MKFYHIILTGLGLISISALSGQCPDKAVVYDSIAYLRTATKILPDEELKVLLGFETKMKNCKETGDSIHILLLHRIGVAYNKLNEFKKAVLFTEMAIHMANIGIHKSSVNPRQLVNSYSNLSIYYDSLGLVKEKTKAIDSCIVNAVRTKSGFHLVKSNLRERVEYFIDIGDYKRCYDYAKMAEFIVSESLHGIDSLKGALYFFTWKINALLFQKNFDEAEVLLESKIEECKKSKAQEHLGGLYSLLSEVMVNKKEYQIASVYYDEALKLHLNRDFYLGCIQTLNNTGYYLYFKGYGNMSKALNCYRQAIKYTSSKYKFDGSSDSIDRVVESLNIFGNIANVYVHNKLYDSAFIYFQKAFDQIKPGINEHSFLAKSLDSFAALKKIQYLTGLIIDKADAYLKKYKDFRQEEVLQEALSIYKVADQLLDRIKQEQSESKSKLFWRSDTRRLYDHAIEAAFLSGQKEKAFYFFEKSRSVLLSDELNEMQLFDGENIRKQGQIKKAILRLENELTAQNLSATQESDLRRKLFIQKQEYDKLLATIKINNPLYYNSILDSLITIGDVQKRILTNNSALIELFLGDSALYSLTITRENVEFNQISKKDFDRLSRIFISYTSNLNSQNSNFDSFVEVSNSLYKLIFGNKTIAATQLIISPDGHYFPFEALVTSMSIDHPVYFLEKHAVSYTYSARYLINQFLGSSTSFSNFLGIAPLQYQFNPNLPDLIGSDQSLEKINKYFSDPGSLVAVKASRNNFLLNYADYKIVQLYTHASDSSDRGEPVIWFADSAIYLSELIGDKRPHTRLIVLSACQTGIGRLYEGEGVFSFNRGFAAIGIPSAITNLWSVDSKSTYELTELFYEYVSQGEPTDIALQKAKLTFLKRDEQSLPYYWAAPILVGKAEVIELEKSSIGRWLIPSFCVLLIVLIVWIIRNRSKAKNTESNFGKAS